MPLIVPLSSDHSLTLSVNDINESPSEVVVTSFQFEEGLPVGSTVAQLSSADPDFSDSTTFSLLPASNNDHSKFRIDGDRLNLLVVPDLKLSLLPASTASYRPGRIVRRHSGSA